MIQDYVASSVAGTGAAITIDLGFVPDGIKCWNAYNNCTMEWHKGMGTSLCLKNYQNTTQEVLLTKPSLSIGTTKTQVATIAFKYMIAGLPYAKAAVAAGTAPKADTIPINKYGLFTFDIGSNGTIDVKGATANATGYDTAALAIAAIPAVEAAHVRIGYFTAINTATTFVGATTELDATGVTVVYYDSAHLGYAATNIVTALDTSTTPTGKRGISIGADTDLNISGQTIYYEAWR